LIHASVAFKQANYTPRARCLKGKSWEDIIGRGRNEDIDWARYLTDILEMDLFDHSEAGSLIARLRSWREVDEGNVQVFLERLSLFALYGTGVFYLVYFQAHTSGDHGRRGNEINRDRG
jgi:hypothetical protein